MLHWRNTSSIGTKPVKTTTAARTAATPSRTARNSRGTWATTGATRSRWGQKMLIFHNFVTRPSLVWGPDLFPGYVCLLISPRNGYICRKRVASSKNWGLVASFREWLIVTFLWVHAWQSNFMLLKKLAWEVVFKRYRFYFTFLVRH